MPWLKEIKRSTWVKEFKGIQRNNVIQVIKDREIEEKMKVAELIAEAELLQQKQMIQNEAEKLKTKERLAKAKARIQAYKQHIAWRW